MDDLESLVMYVLLWIKMIVVVLFVVMVLEVGKFGFELVDDEIEFGVGIYSELGYWCEKIKLFK